MAEICVLSPISARAIMLNVERRGLPSSVAFSISQLSFDDSIRMPKARNSSPASIRITYGGMNVKSTSPTSTPSPVTRAKASMTPVKTFTLSYLAESAITASCVLSPNSASAMRLKVVRSRVMSIISIFPKIYALLI
jgi:hypothetical protein